MAQPALGTGGTYPCPPTRVYEIGVDRRLLADVAANAPKPVVLSPRWRQFFQKLCSVRKARRANDRTGSV